MSQRRSTVGRPRKLSDQEVLAILQWYEAQRALKALRIYLKPVREFAAVLGVSPAAVYGVIARRGEYKMAEPKRRSA